MSIKGTKTSYNNSAFTADDINEYFLSVPYNTVQPVTSTSVSPLSYLPDCCESSFQMSAVDVSDVVSILNSLDSTKATGCDGLPVRFLKACPSAMGRLVTRIVNQSILSHVFPSLRKCAVVTPV